MKTFSKKDSVFTLRHPCLSNRITPFSTAKSSIDPNNYECFLFNRSFLRRDRGRLISFLHLFITSASCQLHLKHWNRFVQCPKKNKTNLIMLTSKHSQINLLSHHILCKIKITLESRHLLNSFMGSENLLHYILIFLHRFLF